MARRAVAPDLHGGDMVDFSAFFVLWLVRALRSRRFFASLRLRSSSGDEQPRSLPEQGFAGFGPDRLHGTEKKAPIGARASGRAFESQGFAFFAVAGAASTDWVARRPFLRMSSDNGLGPSCRALDSALRSSVAAGAKRKSSITKE